MAQQQVNINIADVGFNGLDTTAAPTTQATSFAARATNCVIDRFGRIGCRKGFKERTATLPSLTAIASAVSETLVMDTVQGGILNGSLSLVGTGRNVGVDSGDNVVGTNYYFFEDSAGGLNEITLPSLNDQTKLENADIVVTDDRFYVCSETNETMIWDGTSLGLISAASGYVGIQTVAAGPQVAPTFAGAIAAAGRIWGWGHEGDFQKIYYSDLLNGRSYFTVDGVDPASTAGVIDCLEYWPNGSDRIVGLAAHNGKLVVFGRNSILVWNMGDGDPADASSGFRLEDTIQNIGLVSRDAITNIGTDLLFIDDTGVRSLGRTIQEDSSPLGDITYRVRFDISALIASTADKSKIKLEYDSTENIVIALFNPQAYVMDMKTYLTQGESKITTWNKCFFNAMSYVEIPTVGPSLFLAGSDDSGFMEYEGYQDQDGTPYRVTYRTNPLTFGQPANSKFVKQLDYTIISQFLTVDGFAQWGYDGTTTTKSRAFSIDAIAPAYYGQAQYGIDKYGDSAQTLKRYRINTGGKGESFVVGLEVDVNGNNFSLQELNIQTLLGRIN